MDHVIDVPCAVTSRNFAFMYDGCGSVRFIRLIITGHLRFFFDKNGHTLVSPPFLSFIKIVLSLC